MRSVWNWRLWCSPGKAVDLNPIIIGFKILWLKLSPLLLIEIDTKGGDLAAGLQPTYSAFYGVGR